MWSLSFFHEKRNFICLNRGATSWGTSAIMERHLSRSFVICSNRVQVIFSRIVLLLSSMYFSLCLLLALFPSNMPSLSLYSPVSGLLPSSSFPSTELSSFSSCWTLHLFVQRPQLRPVQHLRPYLCLNQSLPYTKSYSLTRQNCFNPSKYILCYRYPLLDFLLASTVLDHDAIQISEISHLF